MMSDAAASMTARLGMNVLKENATTSVMSMNDMSSAPIVALKKLFPIVLPVDSMTTFSL